MIAPRIIARRAGAVLALLGNVALCAGSFAGSARGQEAEALWRSWLECRDRGVRLGGERARLQARADSLAVARAGARAAEETEREIALLARGEVLVDSLRALSAAALAQELLCEQARRRLLKELDAGIAGGGEGASSVGEGALDSLFARRERVLAGGRPPLLAEFDLPAVGEDDPPDLLRQTAAYARDLGDRIDRWIEVVHAEEDRLARLRLAREAARLEADQAFFEDPATARGGRSGAEAGRSYEAGVFGELIARMPGTVPEGTGAEAVLEMLDRWLSAKREELMGEADTMDREADRREREP